MTNPTDRDELEPCPFCGNAPVLCCTEDLSDGFQRDYFVACDHCGVSIHEEFRSDAIAAWNRRATPQAGDALTASGNDVLRELAGQIDDDLIAGIGRGGVIAQGRAMDLFEAMRAALSTTPTMSAEDMREAAAKVADDMAAEWNPQRTKWDAVRHDEASGIARAIRSLPLTKVTGEIG